MKVAPRTPGPAYANLQRRKPREVGSGGASEAMGIWSLVLCCRSALSACLGSDRGGNEPGQPIATCKIGVAHRRSSEKTAVRPHGGEHVAGRLRAGEVEGPHWVVAAN